MGVRCRALAAVLSVSMALPSGAVAADCSQVVEKVQTEARAFQAEADDVRNGCIMSTGAEAKDVSSGGFHIWSIYGWTRSENVG